MTKMKVITVWQPWASLIAIRAKPYEFRGWFPPVAVINERMAIHAGGRPVRKSEVADLVGQLLDPARFGTPCLIRDIALPFLERVYDDPESLPRSHILCTAVLRTPKPGNECAAEFGHDAGNDSDRAGTFNWGWPLVDIVDLVPPVPARGAQGLWNWSGTLP